MTAIAKSVIDGRAGSTDTLHAAILAVEPATSPQGCITAEEVVASMTDVAQLGIELAEVLRHPPGAHLNSGVGRVGGGWTLSQQAESRFS